MSGGDDDRAERWPPSRSMRAIEERDDGIADLAAQRLHRLRRAVARRMDAIGQQRDPATARQIEPQRRPGEAGVADRAGARPAIAGVRGPGLILKKSRILLQECDPATRGRLAALAARSKLLIQSSARTPELSD
ncbi:MAG TPA: hypothetical protein VGD80_20660, partial [Kofleriaceae bacterium]